MTKKRIFKAGFSFLLVSAMLMGFVATSAATSSPSSCPTTFCSGDPGCFTTIGSCYIPGSDGSLSRCLVKQHNITGAICRTALCQTGVSR